MTLDSHGNVDDAAPMKGGQLVVTLPLVFNSEAAPALASISPPAAQAGVTTGTTPNGRTEGTP